MDTLTILKTMRAVVADEPSERLDMTTWFCRDDNCGCILGLTCMVQPLFSRDIGLSLEHYATQRHSALKGPVAFIHNDRESWIEIARIVGVTPDEAAFLFDQTQYPSNACMFDDGKAEALRRLDEVITKYTPSGADTRSGLRLSSVT